MIAGIIKKFVQTTCFNCKKCGKLVKHIHCSKIKIETELCYNCEQTDAEPIISDPWGNGGRKIIDNKESIEIAMSACESMNGEKRKWRN